MDSIAFARSLSSKIYVIVIEEHQKEAKFTNVRFFTISEEVQEGIYTFDGYVHGVLVAMLRYFLF